MTTAAKLVAQVALVAKDADKSLTPAKARAKVVGVQAAAKASRFMGEVKVEMAQIEKRRAIAKRRKSAKPTPVSLMPRVN